MKAAITSAQQAGGLRQLKKLETMRHVQLTALGPFEAHGFDGVTIEEVASAARVSASTVYRPFDTKEGLVIWDEHDPVLLRALAERLRVDALGDAIERRPFALSIAYTLASYTILFRLALSWFDATSLSRRENFDCVFFTSFNHYVQIVRSSELAIRRIQQYRMTAKYHMFRPMGIKMAQKGFLAFPFCERALSVATVH